jgi:DNA-binding MarR family transcriptional regulator
VADSEYIGLLVIAARHAMKRAICDRARAHRLTSQQFWTIVAIRSTPGVTLTGLADLMLVDAPAASRIVQGLATRGLVEMKHDPQDRRRVRLRLTEAGATLGDKLGAISDAYQETMVRGLDAPAQGALRASLRRIVKNMSDFLGEAEIARGTPEAAAPTLARAAGAPTPVPGTQRVSSPALAPVPSPDAPRRGPGR